jgi:hypothetical protein
LDYQTLANLAVYKILSEVQKKDELEKKAFKP